MSDEGLVLALDQGTTSSRAILFDHAGAIVARASRELPQLYPAPGQVEHDPEAIWESQLAVARQVLTDADVAAVPTRRHRRHQPARDDDRVGAGHGSPGPQRHRLAEPGHGRRTATSCERAGWSRSSGRARACPSTPTSAAPRSTTSWRPHRACRRAPSAASSLFGTVDSFLIWRLTGGALHVTDVSNASRTLLFDIHRLAWDEELLAAMDIPAAMLPTVRPSSATYGTTAAGLLGGAVTIGGDAGDQQAATFGQACFAPGMAKQTYGTGAFLLLNTGDRAVASEHGLLTTVGWQLGGDR